MTILCISNHFEASACLQKGDKIFAASEERFSRKKGLSGIPTSAINWILSSSNTKIKDCKKIIYCSFSGTKPNLLQLRAINEDLNNCNDVYHKKLILYRKSTEINYNTKSISSFKKWIALKKIPHNKVVYLDHHEAHARSVLNFYGIKDAQVFTCDGKGGFTSSAVWEYHNKKLIQKSINPSHNSLGYFYGNLTISLGFKAERHEGKLTGLAAYTKPPKDYNKLNPFYINNGKIKIKNFKGIYMPFFDRKKNSLFKIEKLKKIIKKWTKEEVASAAQKILEDTILKWISQNIKIGKKNICLSGGVFANVRLNQKIREKFKSFRIFVNPAMGDLGLVLGGLSQKKKNFFKKKGVYLGPNFDQKKIKANKNLKFERILNIKSAVKQSIQLFNQKNPIGVFHGEMEFGPRALCHRSIIYPATDKTVNKWLNKRLNRTEFMPFAPVVLDIHAKKFFKNFDKNDISSKFMTMTYYSTKKFKKMAPAVIHVDGTARPQILNKEKDPWFYNFLLEYTKKTGEGCLINTSFNNHEEPIVCTPSDAIKSLSRSNVDAIILSKKYIVTKR